MEVTSNKMLLRTAIIHSIVDGLSHMSFKSQYQPYTELLDQN